MNFTKEQQDFIKHCGEHFEVLTGGRGHSKTKALIEDMQKENEKLHSIIKEVRECLKKNRVYIHGERNLAEEIEEILDKENKNG